MTAPQDSRVPPADECVLRPLLEKWSSPQSQKVFVKISRTEEVTYRQMRDMAATTAAGLRQLGVWQGGIVAHAALIELLGQVDTATLETVAVFGGAPTPVKRLRVTAPRYVRVLGELPKTPTQKIQRHLLRSAGVTGDTWDRDAAGIEVGRRRQS